MDSAVIAHELETLYPDPPLYLDTPQQAQIEALWPAVLGKIGPAICARMVEDVLNEESVAYFVESREKAFGFKLGNVSPEAEEEAWKEARPIVQEMAGVLREGEGPLVRGKEVSYADFVLLAAMLFLRACGGGSFERFVEVDPAFGKLFDAMEQWNTELEWRNDEIQQHQIFLAEAKPMHREFESKEGGGTLGIGTGSEGLSIRYARERVR
ncbi:MAG: hypothetical protein Q9220_003356 [cf. Caloplaca sp. 1 TL-2023]